jgi:hypothetical protein
VALAWVGIVEPQRARRERRPSRGARAHRSCSRKEYSLGIQSAGIAYRLNTWSIGHSRTGSSVAELGMMPLWLAHQRSKPQISRGITKRRCSARASSSPERTRASCQLTSAKCQPIVRPPSPEPSPPSLGGRSSSAGGSRSSSARKPTSPAPGA